MSRAVAAIVRNSQHPNYPRTAIWRRTAWLSIFCIGIAAITTSSTVHIALLKVLEESQAIIGQYPTAGMLLFIVCAALTAMLAFASVAVVVPIAVFTWGVPLSLLLLWIGWIIGGAISYTLGRVFGRTILSWAISAETLRKFEHRVRRDMPFGVVVLFQLALPSEIPGYLLGAARYRFDRYLFALGIAELPYAAATIYLSQSFVESRLATLVFAAMLLIMLSAAAVYFLRKHTASVDDVHTQSGSC